MRLHPLKLVAVPFLLLATAFWAIAEVRMIKEDRQAGLELWETRLGPLWIPKPGFYVMKHLELEQSVQQVYHHPSAHVGPGDVVIDCGAHIGGFTRTALRAGARLVVAVEPEKANALAFRRNFADELKAGKVILVEKGIWNTTGSLSLHLSTTGDSHSVAIGQNSGKDQSIEVTTIDALVESHKLKSVDFIKFDIEGSEQQALRGAARVLTRFHPRLAVSSYHKKGDPSAICSLVWGMHSGYLVASKERLRGPEGADVPKVLFFY